MSDVARWWSTASQGAPEKLGGLWFGLVELVPGGWHLYAAGTDTFDRDDETAEWAVGPYRWQPDSAYVALPEVEHLDVESAVRLAADAVRSAWVCCTVG